MRLRPRRVETATHQAPTEHPESNAECFLNEEAVRAFRELMDRKVEGVDRSAETVLTIIGGLGCASGEATWPLARLEIFRWGVHLEGGFRLIRPLVPVWEALFDDSTHIEPCSLRLTPFGKGVRFRAPKANRWDINNWAVFWTRKGEKVLDAVESLGVAVSREPAIIHFLDAGR
jgi:hypothetical protein